MGLPQGVRAAWIAWPRFKEDHPRDSTSGIAQSQRDDDNVIERGFSPGTNLSRGANAFVRFLTKYVFTLFVPFMKYATTPAQGARVIVKAALNESKETGVYLGERGQPMQGSVEVRDAKFQDRVVAETRALLSAVRA